MAKLLLNWEADGHLPFLLDIVPPQAGSLFATKASTAHAHPPAGPLNEHAACCCDLPATCMPARHNFMHISMKCSATGCSKVACCSQLLQAGEWSSEGHWCFPPAFRAAVRQLLLISHKYGGVRRQDGQLRWPFRTEELVGLLLPVMGRSGSLQPWINRWVLCLKACCACVLSGQACGPGSTGGWVVSLFSLWHVAPVP